MVLHWFDVGMVMGLNFGRPKLNLLLAKFSLAEKS